MPNKREPVRIITPGDVLRRAEDDLERREVAAKRRRGIYEHHPHFETGDVTQTFNKILEDAGKILAAAGHGVSDFFLRQEDGPEMRELDAHIEESRRGIKEYAEALRQGKEEWQKGAAEVLERIVKLADDAASLYKAPPEYPIGEDFEKYGKDQAEGAKENETKRALQNQSIALYYLSILHQLSKLNVTEHSKEFQRFVDTLIVKTSEAEDLSRATNECKRQSRLAQYRHTQSQKRDEESAADSQSIQAIPDSTGIKNPATRLTQLGNVEKYKKRADAHVEELGEILADFRKHRQDTLAKMEAYRSQAQKRMNAAIDATARQNAFGGPGGILAGSTARIGNATADAANAINSYTGINRIIPAIGALPGGPVRSMFNDLAERERTRLTAAAAAPPARNAIDNRIVRRALPRNEQGWRQRTAQTARRAEEAEARAEEARKQAKDAEKRVKIAQAYKADSRIPQADRDAISIEAAKETANHANKVAELEEDAAKIIRKIQSNNERIANAFLDINTIIGQMNAEYARINNIITDPAKILPDANKENNRINGVRGTLDANLQKLVKQIEDAEKRKNSAIEARKENAVEELKILRDIHNALTEENNALGLEIPTETAIANLANNPANNDIAILTNLETRQRQLEEALAGIPGGARGLIERERSHTESVGWIRDAIEDRAGDLTNAGIRGRVGVFDLKQYELNCRAGRRNAAGVLAVEGVKQARVRFQAALTNLQNAENDAERVLNNNTTQIGQEIGNNADKVIEALQRIQDGRTAQDGKRQEELSDGHIFVYPKLGRMTMGNDANWMFMREVGGFSRPDFSQKSTGKTRVDYRADIVKIESNIVTRDSKAIEIESIYGKRLDERTFSSAHYDYSLVVNGTSYAGGGRRDVVLKIVERGRIGQPNTAVAPTVAAGPGREAIYPPLTEADCTQYKYIDNMEGVTKIRIIENHNKADAPPSVEFSIDKETMPSPDVDHAIALSRRQGMGWTPEDKSQAWMIDLNAHVLRLPNGLEFDLDLFDWDDTKWDEKNGLTLNFKGPKVLKDFNLELVAALDTFHPKLRDAMNDLREMKQKNLEKKIEWFKQSVKTCDGQKIQSALASIQESEGRERYLSAETKYELQRPPTERFAWKDLVNKKKRSKGSPQFVADFAKNATEIHTGRQNYEKKIKEQTRTIHTNNPLTANYVSRCRARPERFHIAEHKSSQEKLKLWNEISTANGLGKRIDFNLLEDPRLNPPAAAGLPPAPGVSLVKNTRPNGLEMLQEYNMYKNTEHITNPVERQNVERYVADIAYQLGTQMPVYWRNAWNLQRAMDAASEGNLLGKTVDGRRIPGVKDYIQELKQVSCNLKAKSIAELRQADEYHWVRYLRSALGKVDPEGVPEVLEHAVAFAHSMQVSRLNNLECAEKALDLETPTEEIEKILGQMSVEDALLSPYGTNKQEKAQVDLKEKEMPFEDWLKKKSEPEMAKDAAKDVKGMALQAYGVLQEMYDSSPDPGFRAMIKKATPDLLKEIMKNTGEAYKMNRDMAFRMYNFERYCKRADKVWLKDLIASLMMMWMTAPTRFGSQMAQGMIGELLKLALKTL